ncbi:MAG: helix-turn-helix transcriptional regulator [Ruminococcaceae bacterium]|nr:helix-turn-helix transcriptional regulator [Oscillospiraceae bacterium]
MTIIRLRLDKTLKKRNISRYELAKQTGIRYQIIDNYYKNKVIRYDSYVLGKICSVLDCDISDLLEKTEE